MTMVEIKYNKQYNVLRDRCPYGKNFLGHIALVGGSFCRGCEHFVKDNIYSIVCNHE